MSFEDLEIGYPFADEEWTSGGSVGFPEVAVDVEDAFAEER